MKRAYQLASTNIAINASIDELCNLVAKQFPTIFPCQVMVTRGNLQQLLVDGRGSQGVQPCHHGFGHYGIFQPAHKQYR